MPNLPPRDRITIRHNATDASVVARVAPLTAQLARRLIIKRWWLNTPPGMPPSALEDQPWKWEEAAQRSEDSDDFGCYVALTVYNGCVEAQGAMAYDLRAESLREPGSPALYLRYLASAPRNRVVFFGKARCYEGVGKNLALLACLDSFQAGFGGRVLLQPLPESIGFYESLKFRETRDPKNGRVFYEIPVDDARDHLRAIGWIR